MFNSLLAELTLLVASEAAELMASVFLVSAYDLAELRVDDTLVSTLALVSYVLETPKLISSLAIVILLSVSDLV